MKSQLLKPLYAKVRRGLPGLGTPADVARRFGGRTDASGVGAPPPADLDAAADRIAALYIGLGGATGFVGGLPGFLLLPVTLPANLIAVAALQLHLCAALAVLGGHDPEDPETRDQCIRCLLDRMDAGGPNSEDAEVATRTGLKLAERGIRYAAEKTTRLAGWAARSVVLRRTGLGRLPLVGGVLGAGSDAVVTRHVARCARAAFLPP